ncbi:hypothetical protein [Actinoplanes couchii]|uniref:Secreted protein n=1 Tax=Actinoplanes couchii TaxID=403638 RepID=A0ABQ3X6M7_9ACTN|nr:hypothetical protein [Actinoplanes couchii]MDR6325154.1 hypothetical protein [Actinoplanes couchii]GID54139.1 hypothetical protein Aco03nite_025430 [Actinoplanes couchii]
MSSRRHGTKPALALWMLVAVADIAILASTEFLAVLLVLSALALVTGVGVVAARSIGRPQPKPVEAVMRRRA